MVCAETWNFCEEFLEIPGELPAPSRVRGVLAIITRLMNIAKFRSMLFLISFRYVDGKTIHGPDAAITWNPFGH